ncbi:MAG: aspartyl-trna synthetase [Parvularculaceae bacterium]|nr:MAG: aspartyl-trna synthetase [Parvularculaceae bacterium]
MLGKVFLAGFFAASAFGAMSGAEAAEGVDAAQRETPSGLPVPRFVSVKGARTNCRLGPSLSHPVKFVFQRAGTPVLVVAETRDHWRKVRDADGDECWAFHTTLKMRSHVILTEPTSLRAQRRETSMLRGELEAGVMAKLLKLKVDERGAWALVKAGAARGWAPASSLWGARADLNPALPNARAVQAD